MPHSWDIEGNKYVIQTAANEDTKATKDFIQVLGAAMNKTAPTDSSLPNLTNLIKKINI